MQNKQETMVGVLTEESPRSQLLEIETPKTTYMRVLVHVDPRALGANKYARPSNQKPPYLVRGNGESPRALRCWGVRTTGRTTFVASDSTTEAYALTPPLEHTGTTAWVAIEGTIEVQFQHLGPWVPLTGDLLDQRSEVLHRGC